MIKAGGKYNCNTVEQFKIMTWLQANFHDVGLVEVALVDRNHVRIRDIKGGMALLTYVDGAVDLREIYEAC